MRTFIQRFMVAATLAASALAAQAQGVAMALDRAGNVDVVAGGKTARLNVLDYLPANAELNLAAGSSATLVYLASSQEWQFTGPGRYKVAPGQPAVVQGTAPKASGVPPGAAQAMAKMEPAQRERMGLGAVVMRAGGPVRIVSPNGEDLLARQPTLIWSSTGNLEVKASVADASGKAVAQTATNTTQWTLPQDLASGDYTWRVEPADGSSPPRSGRFKVIAANDPRRARVPAQPAGFAQRVAHAVVLEGEDLPHDALVLWRALAAERPDEESLKQWAR
jgi:hypothetical protein